MGMALLVCVVGRPARKVMLSLDVSLVTSFGGIIPGVKTAGSDFSTGHWLGTGVGPLQLVDSF